MLQSMTANISDYLSKSANDVLGRPTTVEGCTFAVERATAKRDKLDLLLRSTNVESANLSPGSRRKYERQIDAIDAALCEAYQLIGGGSVVGSVHGGEAREDTSFNERGLKPCRSEPCVELVDRQDVFEQAGYCDRCFAISQGKPDPDAWIHASSTTQPEGTTAR